MHEDTEIAVLPYAVANVLVRQVFDGVLEVNEVSDIWADLAALGLVLHPFDLTRDGPDVAEITRTPDGSPARNTSDLGLLVRLVS